MTIESDERLPEEGPVGRVIEVDDPELPDFAPRRPLERMATPSGGAVGVAYEGDADVLPTADERAAFVRAAMARDADA